MAKFDVQKLVRYSLFVVIVVGAMTLYTALRIQASKNFDFQFFHYIVLLMFMVIGALIALLPKNVTKKDIWEFSWKLELLPALLFFLLVGTFYISRIRFIQDMIFRYNMNIASMITLSQIMVGYILMQFFFKEV